MEKEEEEEDCRYVAAVADGCCVVAVSIAMLSCSRSVVA